MMMCAIHMYQLSIIITGLLLILCYYHRVIIIMLLLICMLSDLFSSLNRIIKKLTRKQSHNNISSTSVTYKGILWVGGGGEVSVGEWQDIVTLTCNLWLASIPIRRQLGERDQEMYEAFFSMTMSN